MAMTRVTFRGVRLNTRTRDMVLAAEKILGYQLILTQGSYNSGVSASAGTHDGGGAVDIRSRDMGSTRKINVVTAMRRVGFAAWLRLPSEGNWVEHIHCIAVGDAELSRGARNQVTAYKNGRSGLASNGRDKFTRAYATVTWEKYKAAHASSGGGSGATPKPPAKPVVPPKEDNLGNPLWGKGPYNGRWSRGPVPKHPLYIDVIYHAVGVETGYRKDPLDEWEKGHIAKVVAVLQHLAEVAGGKPQKTLVNLIKQNQTLWYGYKTSHKHYGAFDRPLLNLFVNRQGWTYWDGARSDNGLL